MGTDAENLLEQVAAFQSRATSVQQQIEELRLASLLDDAVELLARQSAVIRSMMRSEDASEVAVHLDMGGDAP